MSHFWSLTLHQAVLAATPLAIAGLGELLAETAGVINLGVEGMMLVGAVSGYATALMTQNLLLALLAGALGAGLLASLHALLTMLLRVNQIAAGLTLVFLGTGVSGYAGQSIAGAPVVQNFFVPALPALAHLPWLGPILFTQDWVVYATILLGVLIWALLRYTPLGLHLRAVGEDPAAADAAGLPVARLRTAAIVAGGALAGIGGAYLSLAVAHAWAAQITAGQGWIALALVIAANWRPLRLLGFALLFGIVDSLDFSLQVIGTSVPSSLLQMLPYLFTLAVLFFGLAWRRGAGLGPAALGTAYDREERV